MPIVIAYSIIAKTPSAFRGGYNHFITNHLQESFRGLRKEGRRLFVCPCVNQELIIQIHKLMEIKKNKELYDAPSTRVFEVKIEGVICQSGLNDPTDYIPGDDPFQF